MPIPEEGRRKVFVSYSHTDSEWLKRVQIHLKDLTRRGLVELWDDTKIQSGAQWREEIRGALESAKVAVLLISADFIASDFIAEDELPSLLTAAEQEGIKILPLILSPSRFEKIESLAKFQSVNPPSKPLIELSKAEQERYLVKLTYDVLRAIEGVQKEPTGRGAITSQAIDSTAGRARSKTEERQSNSQEEYDHEVRAISSRFSILAEKGYSPTKEPKVPRTSSYLMIM
jgi:hypothetical protein